MIDFIKNLTIGEAAGIIAALFVAVTTIYKYFSQARYAVNKRERLEKLPELLERG